MMDPDAPSAWIPRATCSDRRAALIALQQRTPALPAARPDARTLFLVGVLTGVALAVLLTVVFVPRWL